MSSFESRRDHRHDRRIISRQPVLFLLLATPFSYTVFEPASEMINGVSEHHSIVRFWDLVLNCFSACEYGIMDISSSSIFHSISLSLRSN